MTKRNRLDKEERQEPSVLREHMEEGPEWGNSFGAQGSAIDCLARTVGEGRMVT